MKKSPAASQTADRRRLRARIRGTVQGVGFRPFVYRLVGELGLAGFVLNDECGVLLEVEGEPGAVALFLDRLPREVPRLAEIDRLEVEELPSTGDRDFTIAQSNTTGTPDAAVTPDTATCDDCLRELFDPGDRRYRYPFINCTNCGPRFTIVRGVPYDRPLTTMAGFAMCEACRLEYEDPGDRRFHAQPNACPECGPAVWLQDQAGTLLAQAEAALAGLAEALKQGRVVAVKGLGGFHLVCRADDETAVSTLRSRKHREDKPFAVMAPDISGARKLIDLSEPVERLLDSRERPIVLAPRRRDAPTARSVAPGSPDLGVMLPYTPLHHLMLADVGLPLVCTSGNVSDEPIAYVDEEAVARLAGIADLFLLHDRPIHMRTDDSVIRSASLCGEPGTVVIRRSRGYVPRQLVLPIEAKAPILACGAELKSAFCLVKGSRALVGHHIGDLKNFETLRSFEEGVAHFERLFATTPEVVAHDLHPDYLSTKYALRREGVAHVAVQHHFAHLAAGLAEYGEHGPALGAIYDGTGYGMDGTIWGGELLLGDLGDFERVGHLWPVRLPGGDMAVRQPWRMAAAWLVEAYDGPPEIPRALQNKVDPARWRAILQLVEHGVRAPLTTSMGRLFDAVAALCGLRAEVTFEGQAAIELEAAASPLAAGEGAYPMPLHDSAGALVLDARETIRAVAGDLAGGISVAAVAARFHNGLADATAEACARLSGARGMGTVVLSGGVFQNRLLLERTSLALQHCGLRVLVPRRLPPNDGGIAFGQAAVAAYRLAEERRVGA